LTNPTPSASGPKKTPRRELLEEAADLIDGDRNVTYGSPTQNFSNIAEMWTTRFSHLLKPGQAFTASVVADAMILVKVARNIAQQKRDNYADIAGYAGCGYEATLPEPEPAKLDGLAQPGTYITINTPTIDTAEHIKAVIKDAGSSASRVDRRR
jgi:hypothetical protein